MSDIAINNFNDLDLTDGDLRIVDGSDAITQHLRIRLRSVKGEWFLDTRIGVPYFEEIFKKTPNLVVVRGVYSRVIRETPGVISLDDLTLTLDGATRVLRLDFSCMIDGSDVPVDLSEELIL